jgi:LPXTG-motif cell wall-anchored protein
MKKNLAFATVLLTGVALFTAGLAPAQATGVPTLPVGQTFFAASGDSLRRPQLTSVDTTTGNATLVGNATGGASLSNAAVNPVDGTVYSGYLQAGTWSLATVDSATGVYTVVAPSTGLACPAITSLTITKQGHAFFMYLGQMCSLNLTSAVGTAVGSGLGLTGLAYLAYNPVDDKVYAFEWDSGTRRLLAYTVNTLTGVATADPAHNISMADYSYNGSTGLNLDSIQGLTFDGNGNLWFVNSAYNSDLIVADFSTGAATFIGEITNSTINPASPHDFYATAIFITGTPTLPDTGANTSMIGGVAAIGSGLLAAGGLALIMVRRRTATAKRRAVT